MEILETEKGAITLFNDDKIVIRNAGSFLDLLFSTESDTIALSRENFDPSFYDLKTGLAGDILQKLSLYKKRLIILGDFEQVTSRSLHDLIVECNRTGQAIFTGELEKAISLLKKTY